VVAARLADDDFRSVDTDGGRLDLQPLRVAELARASPRGDGALST
jgi:hypothetical protein